MWKIVGPSVALMMFAGNAFAQQPTAQSEGTRQVVGLFVNVCVQFAGNPAAVREFMHTKNAPVMPSEAGAVFLRGRKGVVFNASTAITRLAFVSHDDGWCSAFAETVYPSQIGPLFESVLKSSGRQFTPADVNERNGLINRSYRLSLNGHDFNVVVSTDSSGAYQAALTLAPEKIAGR